ncbi:MAG TPA: Na+/H+ antiporter NhaA [Candidatus Wallbacteria bacterium]|nr:Na+/H+ antiporter NhaA [Candidatus Wallbacteria bacterium]
MNKTDFSKMFVEFFESEKNAGMLLIVSTVFSLLAANLFIGQSYIDFWQKYLDLSFGGLELKYSLQHWINDGLATIFFLLIGLEIERELYAGELSSFQKASLPVVAAIGGMAFPALVHLFFNYSTASQAGIGVPMATDIAFALGVLSLIGGAVPLSLKVFLTAFAIIDDLGAILMIAIFYSKGLSAAYLVMAAAVFAILIFFNRLKVRALSPYIAMGMIMWYFMLKSGIHATITGVLLAFAIPFADDSGKCPSLRLQHYLHKPVAFLILPIFAAANTAIGLDGQTFSTLLSANSIGIILGLFLGKPAGVLAFSFAFVSLKLCSLPDDLAWKHILGAGLLGGIGFTMSVFIANLAFADPSLIQSSILAVIAASLLSALTGLIFFKYIVSKI